jgi:hypothetical protein
VLVLPSRGVRLPAGSGWCVSDIGYAAGEEGRPLRDRHGAMSITAIAAGSFCYRSTHGNALLAPGALLLGNAGSAYECSFERSPGDRGLHFAYASDLLEEVAAAVPSVRRTELPVHRIFAGAGDPVLRWPERYSASWLVRQRPGAPHSRRDERRILEVLRAIEVGYAGPQSIAALAGLACMSP